MKYFQKVQQHNPGCGGGGGGVGDRELPRVGGQGCS